MKNIRRRQKFGLLLGLLLMGIGICQIPSVWVSRNSLQKVSGTPVASRTYISWVFTKSYRQPEEISKSHLSELVFLLKEHNQEYHLAENIGDHVIDEKYERMLKGLRDADSVFVWIKKEEVGVWRPAIFQIDSDKASLLSFHPLHIENNLTAVFVFACGLLFISLCSFALFHKLNSN